MKREVEKLLARVQKPGRYTGGEPGQVVKEKSAVSVRFAFCFPDVMEVGMSHLGMKILYGIFNREPDIWCERVFAPWIDMEAEMRRAGVPLYALESGDPVRDFDFIGFTLQYELSYTNVLNMLSLAGVPLLASERENIAPIVVAGGPCACNPEPLADFIDLFFIGEGEEVDLEVIRLYQQYRDAGKTKREFLCAAAQIEGVYVPSLYTVSYQDDGTIADVQPICGAPKKVRKRIMPDMDKAYYPENFVTPLIEIVHDRAVAEVFRGCIRGCRFCQAGFMCRPVREKSVETVNAQCRLLCENTGYDEISLSSLSTSDYTKLEELLDVLHTWTEEEMVSVSLPSLRVDGFSNELTERIQSVRRGGLTFAPEAGTQRMRNVINKAVTEEQLLNTAAVAFAGGWTKIKLYFMIGLPTETDEDVAGIAQLGQAVVDTYYRSPYRQKGKSVTVTLSVASFVPKPFTPFQWEAQDDIPTLRRKQKVLVQALTTKKITCNWHDADTSWLEGVFARGDRRLGAVLLEAHRRGLRFDGWSDCFSLEKWLSVFQTVGVEPAFYNGRKRSFEEILPWDHLDYGVQKAYLVRECRRAYEAKVTPNCREKCSGCGANQFQGVKGGVCP